MALGGLIEKVSRFTRRRQPTAHNPQPSWLIAGLGNPGAQYADTPHNLGFRVIDRLGEAHGIRVIRPECSALVGAGSIEGRPVVLAKPQTFMNASGTSVRRLLEKYSLSAGELVVVFDELALPWGLLRVRPRGSAGGHNGVKSVIAEVGTTEFVRVRLGVHPGHPVRNGTEFLLAPMRRARLKELDAALDQAARAVESIIAEGVEKSMARFNRRAPGSEEEG